MRLFSTVGVRIANMRGTGLIALIVILGSLGTPSYQFLNNRPHPTYSLENMPDTEFTCRGKVLGGYYADLDTECQMFHICVKVSGVGVSKLNQIILTGFESKAVRYGDDEDVFALQRAETGDIRLNQEKESEKVNQQPEPRPFRKTTPKQQVKNNNSYRNNNENNNERDIFKGSSSGHYFNNRNNGKEYDEDYDDGNYNANQNGDRFQTRKVNRKPVQNQYSNNNNNNNNNQGEDRTSSTRRPTGFVNNFAGSSYVPTTPRPKTTTSATYKQNNQQNYNNNSPTQYTVSTPAPFRQTQQYNNANRRTTPSRQEDAYTENYPKQKSTKERENYPTTAAGTTFNNQKYYNTQYKTRTTETENYPSTARFENQKQKAPKKTENYPTTFAPKNNNVQQKSTFTNTQTTYDNLPTTFSPRTNAAFAQIAQQTTSKQQQNNNSVTPTQYTPQNYFNRQTTNTDNRNTQPLNQKAPANTQQQTQTTQFTQYTPTVPKVTTKYYPTTQPPRFSNRYDETQYDDTSSDSKEEFLSAAHSTNIANSRNELQKTQKSTAPTTTQKPKPFSLTTSKSVPQVTQTLSSQGSQPDAPKKKPKDYDYAYYDTNVSEGEDYDVHAVADIKKSDNKKQ
ncbi:putative mediator of RNA polymerase II transcription subunit 29 [Agrilus planipennis]|uniref:Mediator of RNA polymerase II transcription subunit 29 n=1 Tax=Agrilus planipennis TaxID=224129 RepID=A0A7F5QVA7_AGRPL|nr:putative mediator of RNA polymerase II transcription subunit 29 [Agrilus planipennis]